MDKKQVMMVGLIALAMVAMLPSASAALCDWIPFWNCEDEVSGNTIEAGSKWLLDYTNGVQEEYFDTEITQLGNGKAKVCLVQKEPLTLRINDDIVQESRAVLRKNNVETGSVEPADMEVETEGGKLKKMCVDVDIATEDYIKFGEHSTVVTYVDDNLEIKDENDTVLQDITLLDNSDQCLTDCYAEGTTVIYNDNTTLFDGYDFVNSDNNLVDLNDVKIYVGTPREIITNATNYTQNCTEVNVTSDITDTVCEPVIECADEDFYGNGTLIEVCRHSIENYYNVSTQVIDYERYYFTNLSAGAYYWKIEASKDPDESIDWAVSLQGFDTHTIRQYWAWWNSPWTYRRSIINLEGEYPTLNLSKQARGKAGFGDLRFLDGSETFELNYTIRTVGGGEGTAYSDLPTSITDNLVAYYDLENDSALDLTGNGNDGTMNGVSWNFNNDGIIDKGYFGYGVQGSLASSIQVDSISTGNEWSSAGWFKSNMTSCSTGNYIYDSYWDPAGAVIQRTTFGCGDATPRYFCAWYNGTNSVVYAGNLNDDEWHHFACVLEGTTGSLYIDGQLESSLSGVHVNISGNGQTAIGANRVGAGINNPYNGMIDEVMFVDKALSEDEVAQIYNAQWAYVTVDTNNYTNLANFYGEGNNYANLNASLQSKIVAYWSLNETSGTLEDWTGNGNDGTNNGSTSVVGYLDNAYDFEESESDKITINDSTDFDFATNGKVSMFAWVKAETVPSGTNKWILGQDDNSLGRNFVYGLTYDGSVYRISFQGGGAGTTTTHTIPDPIGEWIHVGLTFDDTTNAVNFYYNGELAGTGTSTGDLTDSTGNVTIGTRTYTGSQHFDGVIDEVLIANDILTAAEVAELYNEKRNYSNPGLGLPYEDVTVDNIDAYYKFDTGVEDSNGTNDLTNIGASQTTGKLNNAYDFDGGTDYMHSGAVSGVVNGGDFSVNVWVNLDTCTDGDDVIYVGTSQPFGIECNDFASGNWYGYVHGVTGIQGTASAGDIGSWVMMTLTYDGTNLRFYRNGVNIGNSTGTSTAQQGNIYIGANNVGTQTMDGQVDEVLITKDALTPAEIIELYNNRSGFYAPAGLPFSQANESGIDNMVAYYSLEESSAPLTDDYDSNDLGNLNADNVDYGVRGKISNGVRFNDLGSSFNSSSSDFDVNNFLSMSLWVKFDTSGDYEWLAGRSASANWNNGYGMIKDNTDKVRFFLSDWSTHYAISDTVPLNTWIHFVGTYDNNTIRLYQDGVLVNTSTSHTGDISTSPLYHFYLGGHPTSSYTYTLDGVLDEVLVTSDTLTQEEVLTLYNNQFFNNSGEIYMYYGNENATTTESINDTFLYPEGAFYFDSDYENKITGTSLTVGNLPTETSDGYLGGAYDYDGINDVFTIPIADPLVAYSSNSFTLIMALETDDTAASTQFAYGTNWAAAEAILIGSSSATSPKTYSVYADDNSGEPTTFGSNAINTGEYFFYTIVFDRENDRLRIYENGELDQNVSWGSATGSLTSPKLTAIGAFQGTGSIANFWQGKIDEMFIYHEALDHDQALAISSLSDQTATYILGEEQRESLYVEQVTPADAYTVPSDTHVFFQCDAIGINTYNVSLFVNDVLYNSTVNTSVTSSLSVTGNLTMGEGINTWYCDAYDIDEYYVSPTRNITTDWYDFRWDYRKELSGLNGTYPTMNLTMPNNSFGTHDWRFVPQAGGVAFNYTVRQSGGAEGFAYADLSDTLLDGLVSSWSLEEASGTVIDNVGTYNGTNNGATTQVTGKVNDAYDFEASEGDYVYTGNFPTTSQFTLSAWIKPESITGSHNIMARSNNVAGENAFAFRLLSTGRLCGEINGGFPGSACASSPIVPTGEWSHAVMTWDDDADVYSFYLNGVLIESGSHVATQGATASELRIGAREYPGFQEYFDGVIDEPMYYNEILRAEEVAQLYNAQWALVTVDTNYNDTIDWYYGNEDATAVSDWNDTFSYPSHYFQMDEASGDLIDEIADYALGEAGVVLSNDGYIFDGRSGYSNTNRFYDSSTVPSDMLVSNGNDFSIVTWVNLSSTLSGVGKIAGHGGKQNPLTNGLLEISLQLNGASPELFVLDRGTVAETVIVSDDISLNEFHQIAVTHNGSNNYNIYIDGVFQNSTSAAFTFTGAAETVYVGTRYNGNTAGEPCTDCIIDEVSWYDKALSDDEMLALYTMSDQTSTYVSGAEEDQNATTPLQVVAMSPVDNLYYPNATTVDFSCTTFGNNVLNTSLYINGVAVNTTTNTSTTTSLTVSNTRNLVDDGAYTWYCDAYNLDEYYVSDTRNVTIGWYDVRWDYRMNLSDLNGTYPTMNLTMPENSSGIHDWRFVPQAGGVAFNYTVRQAGDIEGVTYDNLSNNVQDGLLGYWAFEETSGAVVDSSGQVNGTNNGATAGVSGIIGNAYEFDGAADYLNLTDLGSEIYTASFWFYNDDNFTTSTTGQAPVGLGNMYGVTAVILGIGTGEVANEILTVYPGIFGAKINAYGGVGTTINTSWHHVVIVKNTGDFYSIYLDGVKVDNIYKTTGSDGIFPGDHVVVGAGLAAGSLFGYFDGKIDEVAMWNRSLTQAEILEIQNPQWALVTVDTNYNDTIDWYYGNEDAESVSSWNDTFLYPVRYYPFDTGTIGATFGGYGTDVVRDEDLTNINGAVLADGAVGNSIDLETSSSQYLNGTMTNIPTGSSARSVILWYNPETIQTCNSNSMVYWGTWTAQQQNNIDLCTNGYFRFWGWGADVQNTSQVSNTGTWYAGGMTYAGGTGDISVFVDGNEEATGTHTLNTFNGNFWIGHNYFPTTNAYFDGKIDEVMIYDYELSTSQVADIHTMVEVSPTLGAEQDQNGTITPPSTLPVMTLVTPTEGYEINTSVYEFNCNGYSADNMSNVSLWINGSKIYQVNTTTETTLNLAYNWTNDGNGAYTWFCEGWSSETETANATSQAFTVNLPSPVVNMTHPVNDANLSTQTNYFACNVSDTGTLYNASISVDGVVLAYNEPAIINNLSYQESPTVSDQAGTDGSWSMNYNGTWDEGAAGFSANSHDGNYGTSDDVSFDGDGFALINYSVPNNDYTDIIWQVRTGAGYVNITLNDSFVQNGELTLRLYHYASALNEIDFDAYHTTNGWMTLHTASSLIFYEESVWWQYYDDQTQLVLFNESTTVSDGAHNYSCYGNNTNGFETTVTYDFTVDTTGPFVNITNPVNGFVITSFNESYDLNWTVSDLTLDSCWYNFAQDTCYQESANVSNQSGTDDSCGQQYTGAYNINPLMSDPAAMIDGDWATSAFNGDALATHISYINYTKPTVDFDSASVIVKYNDVSQNFTIPINQTCYDYSSTLMFRYDISSGGPVQNLYCYDGSWILMKTFPSGQGTFWEEAILWGEEATNNTVNCSDPGVQLNYPTSNPDNLTINFYANDTFGNVNSSSVTIYKSTTFASLINITSPYDGFNVTQYNESVNLLWSITPDNSDACWYEWEGVNTSVGCDSGTELEYENVDGFDRASLGANWSTNSGSPDIYNSEWFRMDSVDDDAQSSAIVTNNTPDNFNFRWMKNSSVPSTSVYVWLYNGANGVLYFEMTHTQMRAIGGDGVTTIVPSLTTDWYDIEVRNIDWSAHTYDVWVDGVEAVTGKGFQTTGGLQNQFDTVRIGSHGGAVEAYVDYVNSSIASSTITTINYPTSNPANATVTLYANDSLGNIGSNSSTMYLISEFPLVNITSPADGFIVTEYNETITLNWTATDDDLDTCWYTLRDTIPAYTNWSLQDQATATAFQPDETTGSIPNGWTFNYNGSYVIDGSGFFGNFVFDGNYLTSEDLVGGGTTTLYINYSEPSNDYTLIYWQYYAENDYITNNELFENVSVPTSYVQDGILQVRLAYDSGSEQLDFDVYDGVSSWVTVDTFGSAVGALRIYEESIWWGNEVPEDGGENIVTCEDNHTTFNYPTSNPDNLTINFYVNDSFGQENSSSVTIYKSESEPNLDVNLSIGTDPVYNATQEFNITWSTSGNPLDSCWYNTTPAIPVGYYVNYSYQASASVPNETGEDGDFDMNYNGSGTDYAQPNTDYNYSYWYVNYTIDNTFYTYNLTLDKSYLRDGQYDLWYKVSNITDFWGSYTRIQFIVNQYLDLTIIGSYIHINPDNFTFNEEAIWWGRDEASYDTGSFVNCSQGWTNMTYPGGEHPNMSVTFSVNDTLGNLNSSTNTVYANTVPAQVNVSDPQDGYTIVNVSQNVSFTYDIGLPQAEKECWQNWNGTGANNTIECNSFDWDFYPGLFPQANLTICSNDTFGNLNCTIITVYANQNSPFINLTNPSDGDVIYNQTYDVNWSINDSITYGNCYVEYGVTGSLTNKTVTCSNEYTTLLFDAGEDYQLVSVYANDSLGNLARSSQVNITKSFNVATVNITEPFGIVSGLFDPGSTINLSYTFNPVAGSTLVSCWYGYNGSNQSIACANATQTFTPVYGDEYIEVCALDNLGNTGCDSNTWEYEAVLIFNGTNKETFTEGELMNFTAILYSQTGFTAGVVFNGTTYFPSVASNGDYYNLTWTDYAPSVDLDPEIIPYKWTMDVGATTYETNERNISVYNISYSNNCSGATPNLLMNVTGVFDESNRDRITENLSVGIDIDVYTADKSVKILEIKSFETDFVYKAFCTDLNFSLDYVVESDIDYFGTNGSSTYVTKRIWYMKDGVLPLNGRNFTEISQQNVSLYLLNPSAVAETPEDFIFRYYNENNQLESNALIHVYRKDIGTSFGVSEIGRSGADDGGNYPIDLSPNSEVYRQIVTIAGVVVYDTGQYSVLTCAQYENGYCIIDLGIGVRESGDLDTDWYEVDGGTYTVTKNDDTRELSVEFELQEADRYNQTTLVVYTPSYNGTLTEVARDTVQGSTGTVSVTVPSIAGGNFTSGEDYYQYYIYKDSQAVGFGGVSFEGKAYEFFGEEFSLFLALLIVMTLGLMAASGGTLMIVFLIVGLAFSSILGLINFGVGGTGMGVLIYFIIAGGIIIWKLAARGR